jgi:death-on-curing protein
MENISYHVAAGKIDKDLLQNIISELLNEGQISDGMKLEIFNAIQD